MVLENSVEPANKLRDRVIRSRYPNNMNRAEVISRLKTMESSLREGGVAALYLFGSYARDDAAPNSDLDVFVDPVDEDSFSLVRSMHTLSLLEHNFPNLEIGYSTRDGIVPCYLPHIEQSAMRIF